MKQTSLLYGTMQGIQKSLFKAYMREILRDIKVENRYRMDFDDDTIYIWIDTALVKKERNHLMASVQVYLREKELSFVLVFETSFASGSKDIFLISRSNVKYFDIEEAIREKVASERKKIEGELQELRAERAERRNAYL